jgi:hypothetical protein
MINVEPNSISPAQVSLHIESAPSGITASLQPDHGTPPFSATLTLAISPDVPAGKYNLVIDSFSKDGNQSIAYSLTVEQQVASPHSVTIVVQDVYGMPVSGAAVTLNLGSWTPTLQTGSSGTVVFSSVPASPFNATVSYMGASAVLTGNSLSNPRLEVTVVLSPPVAISAGLVVLAIASVTFLRLRRRSPVTDHF